MKLRATILSIYAAIAAVCLLPSCTSKQVAMIHDAITNATVVVPPMTVEPLPPTPPAPQPPTVVPDPVPAPATGDAIDISKARTISKYTKSIPAMPVAGTLEVTKLTTRSVAFKTSEEPWMKGWGRIAIAWYEGSTLILGEFDAVKPNDREKELENIHGGYIQNKQPPKGAQVWFVFYDLACKQRSTVVPGGVWQ